MTLENILTLTKSLVMLYINAVVESTNENVRSLFYDGLVATLEMQNEIYQAMKNDEYYQVCNVKESDIKNLYNKLIKNES